MDLCSLLTYESLPLPLPLPPSLSTAIKVNCHGSCGISNKLNDTSWTLSEQYFNSTLSVADKGRRRPSLCALFPSSLLSTPLLSVLYSPLVCPLQLFCGVRLMTGKQFPKFHSTLSIGVIHRRTSHLVGTQTHYK